MALNLDIIGNKTEPFSYYCDHKKIILYALSIGANINELNYIYEKKLFALPTFGVILAYEPYDALMAQANLNMPTVLHGEEKVIIKKPIPISQNLYTTACCSSIYDKGDRGAIINIVTETKDKNDQDILETHITIIDRSAGNFGGERGPKMEVIDPPKDKIPDFKMVYTTSRNQAALYRLNADMHPLHIDPEYAKNSGFKQPILHGLCTFGYSTRAIIKKLCNNDPNRLKSFSARFKDVVYPGEKLTISAWKRPDRGNFVVQTVANDNRIVLANAIAEIV